MSPELSPAQIETAVADYGLEPLAEGVADRFAAYAGLLIRWNAKLNLTALRSPQQILERHFLECIFVAQNLGGSQKLLGPPNTLLDFGSGAGFPGIPIALCRPEIAVTLAESQGKKAAFLREAVRVLRLSAEVYSGRVEDLAADRDFGVVAMRAVDKMAEALPIAASRVGAGGFLILLTTQVPDLLEFVVESALPLPFSDRGMLVQLRRSL